MYGGGGGGGYGGNNSGRGSWGRGSSGGRSKGKGNGSLPAAGVKGAAPQWLQAGEVVHVFHRYCQDPNGYFMVEGGVAASGLLHPSVGRTDGWTEGRVTRDWDAQNYDPSDYNTWVEIMWTHRLWYNRRGRKLDTSNPQMVTQKVPAEQVRKQDKQSEAQQRPKLTLVHVRWGGEKPVDPVTEGAGGWGQIGSTPSDNYINGWEDRIFKTIGPTYEIISAFIQSSEELGKICPALIRHMAKAPHIGAFYFLWPILFQDGHDYPAYVNKEKEYDLMTQMESAGIPTRFPHCSHLYKIYASKEWTTQMCLHPLFNIPLTTAVSRQAIACDPAKAAETAIRALGQLSLARAEWTQELNQPPAGKFHSGAPVTKGVAKLGYSWEAMDVQVWQRQEELTESLASLAQQPGSLVDQVLVQEWVDFDVEMRHFVVEPDLSDPKSWKPKKIVFTVMKKIEDNCFREFDRFERATALKQCFANDEAAMADAERQAEVLIHRWLCWLQAQSHELPVVTRFDILARRSGPGKAIVQTGELTELGGCFLGWPQGPEVVFGAMLRSCFKDTTEVA